MTIIDKQWKKGVNIQRANLLQYKEIQPTGRLPTIHTYHRSIVRVNKKL